MALSLVMHRRLQEKKSQHLFSRMIPKRGQGASCTRFPGVVPTKPARVLGLFLSGLPCTLPFSTLSSSFMANQAGVQVRPKKILPENPGHFPSPLANHFKFGPLCANVYCAKRFSRVVHRCPRVCLRCLFPPRRQCSEFHWFWKLSETNNKLQSNPTCARRNTNRKTLTSVISCFTCEPEKKST